MRIFDYFLQTRGVTVKTAPNAEYNAQTRFTRLQSSLFYVTRGYFQP